MITLSGFCCTMSYCHLSFLNQSSVSNMIIMWQNKNCNTDHFFFIFHLSNLFWQGRFDASSDKQCWDCFFGFVLQTVTHISDSRKSTHIQVKLESQKIKYLLTRTITFILKLFPTLMNANIFELTQTKFIIYCRISFLLNLTIRIKRVNRIITLLL
jgi:hypothetical protein